MVGLNVTPRWSAWRAVEKPARFSSQWMIHAFGVFDEGHEMPGSDERPNFLLPPPPTPPFRASTSEGAVHTAFLQLQLIRKLTRACFCE